MCIQNCPETVIISFIQYNLGFFWIVEKKIVSKLTIGGEGGGGG